MSALLAAWGLISRILAFLGIPTWVPLAGVAGVIALGGAYFKGHHDAAQACHDAALRAVIAAQKRDLEAAETSRQLEAQQNAELEDQRQQLAKEVADYEAQLRNRPEPNCALTPADIDGLRHKRRK